MREKCQETGVAGGSARMDRCRVEADSLTFQTIGRVKRVSIVIPGVRDT